MPSASVGGRREKRRVMRSALEGHMWAPITSGWMEDEVTAGAAGTVPRGLTAGARTGQGPEHLAAVGQTRAWHLQCPRDTGKVKWTQLEIGNPESGRSSQTHPEEGGAVLSSPHPSQGPPITALELPPPLCWAMTPPVLPPLAGPDLPHASLPACPRSGRPVVSPSGPLSKPWLSQGPLPS